MADEDVGQRESRSLSIREQENEMDLVAITTSLTSDQLDTLGEMVARSADRTTRAALIRKAVQEYIDRQRDVDLNFVLMSQETMDRLGAELWGDGPPVYDGYPVRVDNAVRYGRVVYPASVERGGKPVLALSHAGARKMAATASGDVTVARDVLPAPPASRLGPSAFGVTS